MGQPLFVGPQLVGADIAGETCAGHHDSPKLKAPTYAKASVGSRGSWIACAPEGMDRGSTVHSSHLFIHPAILNERTAHGARRLSPNAGSFIERVRPHVPIQMAGAKKGSKGTDEGTIPVASAGGTPTDEPKVLTLNRTSTITTVAGVALLLDRVYEIGTVSTTVDEKLLEIAIEVEGLGISDDASVALNGDVLAKLGLFCDLCDALIETDDTAFTTQVEQWIEVHGTFTHEELDGFVSSLVDPSTRSTRSGQV
ncbi:MAG TPA: hypothetical protein VJC18_05230 [bacterium]|nr:hypothetical protein [bacterium]